ncbi:MAG: holo-ACP synthase [Rhodospirillales bacterium]|nr:holo-ACP synthase [Rhodospirillales bacterium]
MIVGLGHDVCDVSRIRGTLTRFGERFTQRVFTEVERGRCDRRRARAEGYARRFAAKEACAKALGTGIRQGVRWRDLEVRNLPSGQPTLRLTGPAAVRLQVLIPPGMEPDIQLTLSDDRGLAYAIVIISARSA